MSILLFMGSGLELVKIFKPIKKFACTNFFMSLYTSQHVVFTILLLKKKLRKKSENAFAKKMQQMHKSKMSKIKKGKKRQKKRLKRQKWQKWQKKAKKCKIKMQKMQKLQPNKCKIQQEFKKR